MLLAAGVAAFLVIRPARPPQRALPIPGDRDRITVEVLNGSGVDGLAASTTRALRREGIDVVFFGTAAQDTFATTLVLARSGDSVKAVRVRDALGFGLVGVAPAPHLLLDVSVILGRDATLAEFRP